MISFEVPKHKGRNLLAMAFTFLALTFVAESYAADPLAELNEFSAVKAVDLKSLHQGEIVQGKVSMSEFPRGLAGQAVFVIPVEFSKAVQALQTWDTSQDSALGTYVHRPLSSPTVKEDFAELATLSKQPKFLWLSTKIQDSSSGKRIVFLSDHEMAHMNRCINTAKAPDNILAECWPEILVPRATKVQTEGLQSAMPYDVNGSTIHIAKELKSLLAEEPEVMKQFDQLLQKGLFNSGVVPLEYSPKYYWEIDEIDKHPAFNLGLTLSMNGENTFQLIDLTYYSSGGFYTSATMVQFWPVNIDGKPETLAWRGDIVSAPDLENIYGIEKMAAGKLMLKEMKSAIQAFKSKAAK